MKRTLNEKCYSMSRKVPRGKVTTYQELARALNCKAYRAVGNAMRRNPYSFLRPERSNMGKDFPVNKNPYSTSVPCHRVVKRDGKVGGFAFGKKKKIEMLRKEGVVVENGRIDLKKYLHRF